ncbi:MAG: diguanylate cyclase [Rhodocyclaceae bacterium]|nr:diguanylate cyclase [Rhodocyclaceae bacterium]
MNDAGALAALPAPRLRLLSALTLALAVIAVVLYGERLGASNERLRAETLAQAEQHADQLAGAVAEQAAATFRGVDFAVSHLRDEYAAGNDLDTVVRTVYGRFPANAVTQVGVIGADGYLAWSSVGVNGRIYLGDREHFKAHLGSDDDRLFISRPVLGRASGAWSIQFTRPIRRRGEFIGVMVLSLAPQYFANSLDALALNDGDAIVLFKLDGTYLARTPNLAEAMGTAVPADRPFVGADAPRRGVFRSAAAFDHIHRIYAWRRLKDYPILATVGLDEAAILAPLEREVAAGIWRRNVGSLAVLALALAVSLLLARAARQQQALLASEMRHRGIFEKNSSVHLLIDPSDGRIVDANSAAAAYYGYPREQLLAMRMTDINCLPADQVLAEMESAKAEKRLYFNFRHRLAAGDIRDVEVYSGPVEVDGRSLLFSIVHDVTVKHDLERRLAASEEVHRSLFLTMAEGVIVVNGDGRIAAWNNAALEILGVDVAGLVGRASQVVGAAGEKLALDEFPTMRAARGEQLDHVRFGVVRPDGRRIWVTVSSRPLGAAGGAAAGAAVLSFSDITSLVEAEESLRLAQSVFEVAGEGILVTDADNRIVAVNPAFTTLTGYAAAEVVGKTPALLASGLHDAAFYAAMWQRLARDGHWEGEISNRRKDGSIFVEWLRITIVPERPGHGRRHVALFSDITDRKREAEAVWRQANFDALTGLPNRKLLEDRLKRAIAQAHRKHAAVALLFIDLDRFKPVNDAHGHAAGDELLRQVARRLEHCLRDEDTIARLGGDEFIVVLPDVRVAESPAKTANKIVAVLSEPFRVADQYLEISCSIGISLYPKDAGNVETLIATADAAMYAAKDAGRATWRSA